MSGLRDFLPVIQADPNDTSEHPDVIKDILKAKSENGDEQARALLEQFFPVTPPADPNARRSR
jgi:hypothetical protein